MIEINDKTLCCGCNACGDVCTRGAITFQSDTEGFLYPIVNTKRCTRCGACLKVCPILKVDELRRDFGAYNPKVCASVAKDLEIRFDSTSGGVFSVLAHAVFEKGGFVGGAVWGDDFEIFQIVSDSVNDLSRLRSSKYAQSNAIGFYTAVKKALQTTRPVLLCGTPCQMVAIRAFLGKEYPNLIIADFICRGINSPLIMRKYIEMFETRHGGKVVAIKQKSKELGWHRLTTKFTFNDGAVKYDPREKSLFMRGYLQTNSFCRPSCYACKFKGFPRLADITLADCWGAVSDLNGVFDMDIGTSLVICNTAKGKDYFESVSSELEIASVDWDKVLKGNRALETSLSAPKINRDDFFNRVNKVGFEAAISPMINSRDGRSLVRRILSRIKCILENRCSLWRLLRINGVWAVLVGKPLILPASCVVFDKSRKSDLTIIRDVKLGVATIKGSRLESRILMQDGAHMILHGGIFSYGANIELFSGAKLEIGQEFYSNIGATIICSEKIEIGEGVILGRNVTIRDTNGNHYINSANYRNTAPVKIGDHVWLCENSNIMPGVEIGSGSIVAAGAVVTKSVPANTLVAGIPAKIIRTGVQWKR